MAWEARHGKGRYYTRSVRRGSQVVREYYGVGPRGEAAASADRQRRAEHDVRCAAHLSTLGRIADADTLVKTLFDTTEPAVRAALLQAGYHQHARGAWRRRRA